MTTLYMYKVAYTKAMAPVVFDGNKMHKLLTQLVGTDRASSNLLYYLDLEYGVLFVQSDVPLMSTTGLTLLKTVSLQKILNVSNGEHLMFRLTTDPRKKRDQKIVYITDPEEQIEWVKRRLSERGFDVEQIQEISFQNTTVNHCTKKGGKISVSSRTFMIAGSVQDRDIFIKAWQQGLGWHKAYGNGLFVPMTGRN